MTSQGVQTVRAEPEGSKPDWLWTWAGICFGYRLGDSLFTPDGVEVGRFSGSEVYGVDGRYLGELRRADDSYRLITNLYKKLCIMSAFAPTFDRFYRQPANRAPQPLYSGHEDFPSPEIAKTMVFPK
jgi:hypothetical protein